jgi:hypothetical protein
MGSSASNAIPAHPPFSPMCRWILALTAGSWTARSLASEQDRTPATDSACVRVLHRSSPHYTLTPFYRWQYRKLSVGGQAPHGRHVHVKALPGIQPLAQLGQRRIGCLVYQTAQVGQRGLVTDGSVATSMGAGSDVAHCPAPELLNKGLTNPKEACDDALAAVLLITGRKNLLSQVTGQENRL